jgi:hypothetical protein
VSLIQNNQVTASLLCHQEVLQGGFRQVGRRLVDSQRAARDLGIAALLAVAFLDHCTERALLRRVGGGYVFIHRLLLEHIAGLNKDLSYDPGDDG